MQVENVKNVHNHVNSSIIYEVYTSIEYSSNRMFFIAKEDKEWIGVSLGDLANKFEYISSQGFLGIWIRPKYKDTKTLRLDLEKISPQYYLETDKCTFKFFIHLAKFYGLEIYQEVFYQNWCGKLSKCNVNVPMSEENKTVFKKMFIDVENNQNTSLNQFNSCNSSNKINENYHTSTKRKRLLPHSFKKSYNNNHTFSETKINDKKMFNIQAKLAALKQVIMNELGDSDDFNKNWFYNGTEHLIQICSLYQHLDDKVKINSPLKINTLNEEKNRRAFMQYIVQNGMSVDLAYSCSIASKEFLSKFSMVDSPLYSSYFFRVLNIPLIQCPKCLFCSNLIHIPENPILIFDTETTGLRNNDQIIELGYILTDSNGNIVRKYTSMWKTEVRISETSYKIHGISEWTLAKHGMDPRKELLKFLLLLYQIEFKKGKLVAHNLDFDFRMVVQTARKLNIYIVHSALVSKQLCTLKEARKRSHHELGNDVSNFSIYQTLGGPQLKGNIHRALTDCELTHYNYFQGKKRKWWW